MAQEIKSKTTGGKKVETYFSAAFKAKFAKYCKKANVSVAQRLRDLAQADLKGTIVLPE